MRRRLLLLLALLGITLRAHDAGLSTVRAVVGRDTIEITVAYAVVDARIMLPGHAGPASTKTTADFALLRAEFDEMASIIGAVETDGKVLRPLDSWVEWVAGDNVAFRYTYPHPAGVTSLRYRALNLRALPSKHREHFRAQTPAGAVIADRQEFRATCRLSSFDLSLRHGPARPGFLGRSIL